MDPRLPFGFLDHKMKTGNALIGCWFDRFQDYPAMAWERDGGDSGHDRFVEHFREYVVSKGKNAGETKQKGDKWTQAIKDKKEEVRTELVQLIRARRTKAFEFFEKQLSPIGVHDHLVGVFEQIHNLPIHETEERRRVYEQHFGPGSAYRQLRAAFDTWCAIWFWPGDLLGDAPLPTSCNPLPPRRTSSANCAMPIASSTGNWNSQMSSRVSPQALMPLSAILRGRCRSQIPGSSSPMSIRSIADTASKRRSTVNWSIFAMSLVWNSIGCTTARVSKHVPTG